MLRTLRPLSYEGGGEEGQKLSSGTGEEGINRADGQGNLPEGGSQGKGVAAGGPDTERFPSAGKLAWMLNREYGISMAEIARQVGYVCTSAIAKSIQKMEAKY